MRFPLSATYSINMFVSFMNGGGEDRLLATNLLDLDLPFSALHRWSAWTIGSVHFPVDVDQSFESGLSGVRTCKMAVGRATPTCVIEVPSSGPTSRLSCFNLSG